MGMYKKRPGTSGISGHLYETKLISLLLFNLLHNDTVEEFYLASNMDDIGEFDDICLKIKLKGSEQYIRAFVQIKHRDNDDTSVSLESDSAKWCRSFVKIKQTFYSKEDKNEIFSGEFNEMECHFILYTNGKYTIDTNTEAKSSVIEKLNTLLATSNSVGSRLVCTKKDIEGFDDIITNEEITMLAKRFVKYLNNDPKYSMNIMNDEYVERYHVILAKEIVDVSEIHTDAKSNSKYRIVTFRRNVETDDKYIKWFLEILYDHVIRSNIAKYSPKTEATVDQIISLFLSKPSALTLSPLIETHITHKNNSLEFMSERPLCDKQKLDETQMSRSEINKAKAIAAKKILEELKITVPIAFGNKDLALRGNKDKIDKRINYLTEKIIALCENLKNIDSHKVITIDDSIDTGILSSNGGLGGAVGNILVFDEGKKLYKFSNSLQLPKGNAKSLLLKLEDRITNLQAYRFHVSTVNFPKLSFDCTDTANDFLQQLLIYSKQSNHKEVEKLLKEKIEEQLHLSIGTKGTLTSDIVYLHYHNEVQKWWMTPKIAPYITKESNIYSQIINDIETKMGVLENTFYMNKIRYFGYTFLETTKGCVWKYLEHSLKFTIASDITALTTVKIIQYLRYKSVVLDLDLILNLRDEDFGILSTELEKTAKIPIVVCDKIGNATTLNDRLQELKQLMKNKNIIIITSKAYVAIIQKHFRVEDYAFYEDNNSLVDLSAESQKEIILNSKATLQGREINLLTIVDDASIAFIKGDVLKKIIDYGHILIGDALSDANYENIKDLFIHRRVTLAPDLTYVYKHRKRSDQNQLKTSYLRTFYDIKNDLVFLTAKPGMGKSTLLTHLSIKTKELNESNWIIRINLLYHSKEFYLWHKNKTRIDTLQILKFLCGIVSRNNKIIIDLKEIDNKAYLVDCTDDEMVAFTLNTFLQFYNNGKVIVLCDGFDEICPDYKDTVIKMLTVIKTLPQKIKLWVTSRPYREIVSDLISILGTPYVLEYLSETEQRYFLNTYIKKTIGPMPEVELVFNGKLSLQQDITDFLTVMYAKTGYKRFAPLDKDQPEYNKMHEINTRLGLALMAFYITVPRDPIPTIFLNITEVEMLTLGSPLLLKLLADYIIGLQDDDIEEDLGDMNSIIFMHGILLDNKLKNMFQEKYKMDVHTPFIKLKYEEERASTHNLHKKLAAHELFGSPLFSKFVDFDEFKDMGPFTEANSEEHNAMIEKVQNYAEIVGIITSVTEDKRPVFIHRTFLEYFAIEFIIDILKSDNFLAESRSLLLTVIVKHSFAAVMPIVQKTFWDNDFAVILNELANPILLFNNYQKLNAGHLSYDQYARLLNSAAGDFEIFNLPGHGDDNTLNVMADPLADNTLKPNESIVDKMKPHLRKHFM